MKKKKKILYIHHGKGLGGAPLSLLYLIEGLDKNLFEPVVLFLHDSTARDLFIQYNITTFGPTNTYDTPHSKIRWLRWYHIPMIIRTLVDTIKTVRKIADYWYNKINPDIVHLNTSSLSSWAYVAYKRGIPITWHIREPLASGYLGIRKSMIIKLVGRYANAIVPICNHDALPWQNNPKTSVLYNIAQEKKFNYKIDPQSFLSEHNLCEKSPKIFFLGGLSEEKGTLLILKIFEQLSTKLPNAQLLIAGNFDCETEKTPFIKKLFPIYRFKKKIKQLLAKNKNIKLLGPILNIPEAMAASNVIVFPATVGHFARPIIEAGFMKKSVIASNLHPLNELIIDKKTGYLIDPHDLAAWVETLHKILTDRSLQEELGQHGFSFCTKTFSHKKQIEHITNIYNHLLN